VTNRDWAYISNDLIYVALFAYAIAFLLYAFETAFSVKESKGLDRTRTIRSNRVGTVFFILGTSAISLGVIARGVSAGRVPWGNMYEFSISGAMFFALAYLIIGKKYDLRWLGLPISILLLLIIGTAITLLYRPSAPLVPALQSTWLVVHVAAAIISGGMFLLSNTVASTYLWLERMERKGGRSEFAKRCISALDLCDYCWRHLGRSCMGKILGLGSQRDLVLYYLDSLCRLFTCSSNCRVEGS
jgi:ABC-type transport system involved in cytochrome c biogenesis permease subunit